MHALSVGSVPAPSPLRVDEGGFSRRYTVFLPSVAFDFVFSRLPPLVELLAALAWMVALVVVIAWVCCSCRFSCFFFFFSPGNWIVSWFGGCVGNWFNGCVSVGHTMVMEVHPYHVRRQVGFSIKLNNCQETDARSTQTTSIQIILQNINNIWRRNMKVARFILDNLCTKKCFL